MRLRGAVRPGASRSRRGRRRRAARRCRRDGGRSGREVKGRATSPAPQEGLGRGIPVDGTSAGRPQRAAEWRRPWRGRLGADGPRTVTRRETRDQAAGVGVVTATVASRSGSLCAQRGRGESSSTVLGEWVDGRGGTRGLEVHPVDASSWAWRAHEAAPFSAGSWPRGVGGRRGGWRRSRPVSYQSSGCLARGAAPGRLGGARRTIAVARWTVPRCPIRSRAPLGHPGHRHVEAAADGVSRGQFLRHDPEPPPRPRLDAAPQRGEVTPPSPGTPPKDPPGEFKASGSDRRDGRPSHRDLAVPPAAGRPDQRPALLGQRLDRRDPALARAERRQAGGGRPRRRRTPAGTRAPAAPGRCGGSAPSGSRSARSDGVSMSATRVARVRVSGPSASRATQAERRPHSSQVPSTITPPGPRTPAWCPTPGPRTPRRTGGAR